MVMNPRRGRVAYPAHPLQLEIAHEHDPRRATLSVVESGRSHTSTRLRCVPGEGGPDSRGARYRAGRRLPVNRYCRGLEERGRRGAGRSLGLARNELFITTKL